MSAPRVKACLNGAREPGEHPSLPVTPAQLAAEARAAVAAGAFALHLHPRDHEGRETLAASHVGAALAAVRAACPGVPAGVSTGLWIADEDPELRLRLVAEWGALDDRPDFASLNLSEEGAGALAAALQEAGVGVEAGLGSAADAELLASGELGVELVRVLVEPEEENGSDAVRTATAIDAALDAGGVEGERIHHGFGAATWDVIAAAAVRGRSVRAGLEDATTLPDGTRAEGNGDLVAAAVGMVSSGSGRLGRQRTDGPR